MTFFEQLEVDLVSAKQASSWTEIQYAVLGAYINNAPTVAVPENSRRYPKEVYIRGVGEGGVSTAINTATRWLFGLPVMVGKPPGSPVFHVMSVALTNEADPVTNDPGVAPHASQHSLRNLGVGDSAFTASVGEDPVFVNPNQIWQASLQPATGLKVYLTPGWLRFGWTTVWHKGEESEDLTSRVPGSGLARFVLIEQDINLNVYYTNGDAFAPDFQPAFSAQAPVIDAGKYQRGYVLLINGVTQIHYGHIWTGIQQNAISDAGMKPETINGKLTIPSGYQQEWFQKLSVTGYLNVQGALHVRAV